MSFVENRFYMFVKFYILKCTKIYFALQRILKSSTSRGKFISQFQPTVLLSSLL